MPVKYVFFLLMYLSLQGCHNSIIPSSDFFEDKTSFSLIKAESEAWSSPLPGGGSGKEYFFTIVIKTSKTLTFDSARVDHNIYPVFITKQSAVLSGTPVKYGNGDTIILRISASANNLSPATDPPFGYEGDALISYKVDNSQKYFIIKKISARTTPPRQ